MSRVAVYSGPYHTGKHLHGLGSLGMAICLGPDQNTVACMDPSCTYGDCGSSDTQQVGGALCLDHSENQIPCSNPGCTYGDCISPAPKLPGSVSVPSVSVPINLVPKPSPTVAVPLSPSSLGLWFTGSSFGLPNWALMGVGFVLIAAVAGGSSGRRR